MKTSCPQCNQHYEIDDEYNGQLIECQKCGGKFVAEPTENKQISKKPQENRKKLPAAVSTDANQSSSVTLQGVIKVLAVLTAVIAGICFYCGVDTTGSGLAFFQATFTALLCSLLLFAVAKALWLLEKIEFNTRSRPGKKE